MNNGQGMAINLETAVDPAVVGVLLVHGTEAERVASLSGDRPRCDEHSCWQWGPSGCPICLQ